MNVKINAPQISADISAPAMEASTGIPVVREHMADAVWKDSSTITVNPTLEVDYDTGTITAAYDEQTSILPLEESGAADKTTAAPVRVKGNTATQLFTIDETTYTPSNSPIIIPEGRFLLGNQTISAISAPYYDMSKEYSWMGPDVTLVKTFDAVSTKLSATTFNTWTPSTTATDILASANVGTFTATDLGAYEYLILWECTLPIVMTGSPTQKALPLFCISSQVQSIFRRPSTWANIEAHIFNGAVCTSLATGTFMRYYGPTTGSITYTWGSSYGFYFTMTAATFSNTTATSPTVTVKSPKVTARCNASYMSTANAGLINKNDSVITIQAKVYRVKPNAVFHGNSANVIKLIESL